MIPNNLFPVAASRGKKTVDPNHHNAGRIQNWNQAFTCHLSWLHLQLAGTAGNLNRSNLNLRHDTSSKEFENLPPGDKLVAISLMHATEDLAERAKELARRVKQFNRTKTKLTKEQLVNPSKSIPRG